VQYRSILLFVQLYIRSFSSMSSHPITHPTFFCLSFATAAKRRPRKQSCKALMFPPAVKHFNLFDALASDGTCVQAKPSNDAADRNSKWIFLKCRMSVYQRAQARSGTRKRDAGKWLIMYRVSATFSGCNRAYRGNLYTVPSFVRCLVGAFTQARFWNGIGVKSIRNCGIVNR